MIYALDRPTCEGTRVLSGAPAQAHVVQFYEDDDFLCGVVADFLAAGLRAGEGALVLATEAHRRGFCRSLEGRGVAVADAMRAGRLTMLDAHAVLSGFLIDGKPHRDLFWAQMTGALRSCREHAGHPSVRVYGELVDILWREGLPHAAIVLEELWNDLARSEPFALLCAYVMGNFHGEAHSAPFEEICRAHAHVTPTERFPLEGEADVRLRNVSVLQQRARALEGEIEHRKAREIALREALAERRRAEEALRASEQELKEFFENAVEGLYWVGPDGVILWANKAQLELLGCARDEFVGHHIAEFHMDPGVVGDVLARLRRNETLRDIEVRLRCKDGAVKHALLHSNALFRDGEFIHARCFAHDITDRKRLEEELRRQNDDLARTVRFSETFVGILGHDLRNPLSGITTAASLLARRADSDKVARPAARILSSAHRMGRMIDQLLDFTRIRLGKGIPLERTPIDMAEVCRLAVDELESATEVPRVHLSATGDLVGWWDGDRLAQLVSNLLGNALAHGLDRAPVDLRVDGTGEESVVIEVSNAGCIPPDVLEVIFDPLKNGSNKKGERSSGLGLGLYITQQIVLAHQGSIEVTSTEPDGTRFTVRLPRDREHTIPSSRSAGGGKI